MYSILEGIFSFFVPFFVVLLHYWYISLPVVGIAVWGYLKSQSQGLRRFLRIILAFVILSAVFTLIYYLFDIV